ncbi:MAG: flavin reductase family protein [Planctomycetota bacterium]|jgi:flavin reductase (DIM6/NTAB) family NADH-FMN oxidoreductase RutF
MNPDLTRAIGQIPCGRFILTAAYDNTRTGVLVDWVQQCCTCPAMVVAAVASCLPVVPLIRDSHSFALCQISDGDRLLEKKFATPPAHGDDPFDTLSTAIAPSGSPLLRRALSYLDCEVVRHIDLESDYGLYVGRVRAGGMLNGGTPLVRIRGNGAV